MTHSSQIPESTPDSGTAEAPGTADAVNARGGSSSGDVVAGIVRGLVLTLAGLALLVGGLAMILSDTTLVPGHPLPSALILFLLLACAGQVLSAGIRGLWVILSLGEKTRS